MFASDAASTATPAPGNVNFEVEPNINTRSGVPAFLQAASRFFNGAGPSPIW